MSSVNDTWTTTDMSSARQLGVSKVGPLPQDSAVALYVALALVLLVSRVFGEIAKKMGQPAVMGELLCGIFLGKTMLFQYSPETFKYLFANGKTATAFFAVTSVCVTMYLLIAGLEMNMRTALKKKHAMLSVGMLSLVIPFFLGFGIAMGAPVIMGAPSWAREGQAKANYAFFCGVAMAITALPVAAKTLRDMHLYRTDLGVIVISSAVLDDILGWTLFAINLSISAQYDTSSLGLSGGIIVSILYFILMLTLGSWFVNKMLPFVQAYCSFPAGEIGFIGLFTFVNAAFALWIGLHNTLGAFIAGAAIGNSKHFRAEMRDSLDMFVSYLLAPIFFGSVALNANFVGDFDPTVVFTVFTVSCAGKLMGGYLGARVAHSNVREAAAIAVCMNARGAMELILASVAVDAGIIDGKMFVALVFMAIVTSLMPGPLLRRILRRPQVVNVLSYIDNQGFFPKLQGGSMQETVKCMCNAIGHAEYAGPIIEAELARSSVSDMFVAVPRVRLTSIKQPIVLFGVSHEGIVFPNSTPVKFIVLILTPEKSDVELDLLRAVDTLMSCEPFLAELGSLTSRVELMASIQIHKYQLGIASENTPAYIRAPIIAGGGVVGGTSPVHQSQRVPGTEDEPASLPSFLVLGGSQSKSEERDVMLPDNDFTPGRLSRRATGGAHDDDMQVAKV